MKVLRPSLAAGLADDDVLLADDRERVDPGGHPAEHHQPLVEVAGPAAHAVERRPGDGERGVADVVDVRVPVLGDARVRRPGGGDPGGAVDRSDRPGRGRSAARRPPRGRCRRRSRSGTGARSGRGTSPSRPGPRRRDRLDGAGSVSVTLGLGDHGAVEGRRGDAVRPRPRPAGCPAAVAGAARPGSPASASARLSGRVVLDQPGQRPRRSSRRCPRRRGSAEPARDDQFGQRWSFAGRRCPTLTRARPLRSTRRGTAGRPRR